jgi:hypothetical protein
LPRGTLVESGQTGVIFCRAKFGQDFSNSGNRQSCGGISGLAQYPHATVFRDQAGCPALRSIPAKPVMGGIMKLVVGIQQGDENVDVQ